LEQKVKEQRMEQNHVYGQAHLAHPLKAIMPIGIGIGLKIVAANVYAKKKAD
jgi:hypothetical protein